MLLIKSLNHTAGSRHNFRLPDGSKIWPLPQSNFPGAWVSLSENYKLKPHYRGFHLTKISAVAGWCWQRNFIAEYDGPFVETKECVVARKVRLIRELFLSPEQWAELAISYLADVIRCIIEVDYPSDRIRAVIDPFNLVAQKFNRDDKKIKFADGKISVWKYAKIHSEALIKLCEEDRLTTVEMGFNPTGVCQLAKAARRLMDLGKGTKEGVDNPIIAKEVAGYARKAAEQFVMQTLTEQGQKNRQLPPETLQSLFKVAVKSLSPEPLAIQVANLMLQNQSARLCRVWGLEI